MQSLAESLSHIAQLSFRASPFNTPRQSSQLEFISIPVKPPEQMPHSSITAIPFNSPVQSKHDESSPPHTPHSSH
jgi:hypothetical protein